MLIGFLGCQQALGMESGAISGAQISASSDADGSHAPSQGRLNFQETLSKTGSWAAGTNDFNQWLLIDLGSHHTKVTCLATQGRNYRYNWPPGSHSQWVNKYKFQYSNDGWNFQYFKEQGQSADKVKRVYLTEMITTNLELSTINNILIKAKDEFKLQLNLIS